MARVGQIPCLPILNAKFYYEKVLMIYEPKRCHFGDFLFKIILSNMLETSKIRLSLAMKNQCLTFSTDFKHYVGIPSAILVKIWESSWFQTFI